VACGSAVDRNLETDLGVSAVVVKDDGSAPLYSEPCVDQRKIVAWVPAQTNLVPTADKDGSSAKALFVTNPNGASLEFGIFYHVITGGKQGWLFSEQLNFEMRSLTEPVVRPTMSPQGQETATAAAAAQVPGSDFIPYYTTIGTPDSAAIGGALYVRMFEHPDFNSRVVALVPVKKGAVVLLVRDNPGGELIKRGAAAFHDGSWFLLQINHSFGWVDTSHLNIQ
jgi:hypothetical protein